MSVNQPVTSTWPFWAPTPDSGIEHALNLADVKPGDRLLDLGCGDGRVLEAAARRGATAIGYEADAKRAGHARERLADLNGAIQVIDADFFTAPLDADVLFAFLSPATLFRLRRRFAELAPGTRLVTFGYGIVGWVADRSSDGCFLYSMPPRPSGSAFRQGWDSPAVVLAGPANRTFLVALPFGALSGELDLEVSSSLPSFAQVYLGSPYCDVDSNVPIDIKVTMGQEGSVSVGGVRLQADELLIIVVATGNQTARRHVKRADIDRLRAALIEIRTGKRNPASLLEDF
jgi:SAM-dependent methyltransferase